jgi:hypothetical protein
MLKAYPVTAWFGQFPTYNLQAQQLNIREPQCQNFKNEKNKVCHQVRESFTDQFLHNTKIV